MFEDNKGIIRSRNSKKKKKQKKPKEKEKRQTMIDEILRGELKIKTH